MNTYRQSCHVRVPGDEYSIQRLKIYTHYDSVYYGNLPSYRLFSAGALLV
jgi:hypothetical protein